LGVSLHFVGLSGITVIILLALLYISLCYYNLLLF
jgi:hypothetical protein